MAPVGADGVRWARAKVACARCIKDDRDCWVASNRRARACEACTRTHVSCTGAVGWGQEEGWPTGATITIKRKAVEDPEEGTAGKRRRREGEEVEEDPLQAIARGINSMAAAAWAYVHDQRERENRRASRAVQTVLELSSDEEDVVVKKEKGKEVDKEMEGETEKEKEKEREKEKETEDVGESEQGEREDEGEESGAAALALFDHISSDIEQ